MVSKIGERAREPIDVVLVVVEVDRKTQVAVAGRADDAALFQHRQEMRGVVVAERYRHDAAAIGVGQVDGRPADLGERLPELVGELARSG